MNCYTAAIVGVGMLAATFATMTLSKQQQDYLKTRISPELITVYERIVAERRNLYLQGIVLGLVVAFFLVRMVKTAFHRVALALAVALPIAVVFYFLMPKSDYMLNHLRTQQETQAWLQVYRTMKHRYFLGFLLGSLSAVPIAFAMCG